MLFRIRQDSDVFELNDGLNAVPAFTKLTDMQMKFVILVADPSRDNPIRTLAGKERRTRAAILAGYKLEPDGKRLARNGREVVYAKVEAVEEAIEEFKKNFYSEQDHNREALKKQIAETREFLESDKKVPIIANGKILLDKHGNEVYKIDHKALKEANDLGIKLPALEKALRELEASEPKFEGNTPLATDFEEEEAHDLPAIEAYMSKKA